MKTNWKRIRRPLLALCTIIMFVWSTVPAYANGNIKNESYGSKYIMVGEQKMHIAFYGDMIQTGTECAFTNKDKPFLVMLPGLGVPSPHIYFKPLAEALCTNFNVVIPEPFGYGLSDQAATTRSADHIVAELQEALDILNIDECVLLAHSISGVYSLNFVLEHPEKIKGMIAIDTTVNEDALQDELAMEQEFMLKEAENFDTLRASFPSLEDFRSALTEDPVKYGATLPEIIGYTYLESDREEYIQAYSLSSNENIKNEIRHMDKSLSTIRGKKFPATLPVLTMLSSDNVDNVPVWKTGHLNQLNLLSGNHELYTLDGTHYIWYTNLSGIVDHIHHWMAKHNF